VINAFLCPTNALEGDRSGGRDSIGFGCIDYATAPYTEIMADGTTKWQAGYIGPIPVPGSLTGNAYSTSVYTSYACAGCSANKTYQIDPEKLSMEQLISIKVGRNWQQQQMEHLTLLCSMKILDEAQRCKAWVITPLQQLITFQI
jgi:hypothetical protein